jgi:hypothetical protein
MGPLNNLNKFKVLPLNEVKNLTIVFNFLFIKESVSKLSLIAFLQIYIFASEDKSQ